MQLAVRIAVVGGIAALTLAGTIFFSLPSRATQDRPGQAAAAVRVASVASAPTSRTVRLHGLTRARERGDVGFTAGGRLQSRDVAVGDSVVAGQVLARLDPVPLAHRVAQARAALDDLQAQLVQIRADRTRLEALDADRAVAPAELERLRSQETRLVAGVEQARVGLDEALRQQREGVLRAPYEAQVVAVHAEPGETVAAGRPVVSLAGSGLEVTVEAPESVWAGVQTGAEARVDLSRVGCMGLLGEVERVGRGAQGPGRLFPVHVRLPEGADCALAPGLTADVSLRLPMAPALSVPVRAVVDPTGSGAAVLRVRGDVVEEVAVTPLRLEGDALAVHGPLETGDEVVIAGLVGLVDGQAVRVLR